MERGHHAATVPRVPRHVPASVSELSRIGLLASLPGERLVRLAERMNRQEIDAGVVDPAAVDEDLVLVGG